MASKPKPAAEPKPKTKRAEGAAEQQPKKRFALPSLKFLIIGGAALLLVARRRRRRLLHVLQGAEPRSQGRAPAAKPAVFVDLPEVLVNLSNTGADRTQYLKVKIVLELAGPEDDRSRSSRSCRG